MAYGDGYKRQPERYEERACPKCSEVRMVRKDQPKTKLCKSCAHRGQPKPQRNHWHPRSDPQMRGSYASYGQAKRRCETKEHYIEYGTEFRFSDFEEWWKELGERPEGGTVDRIDPFGHYEPGNVRWATQAEQNRNRRSRRWAKRPNV